MKWYGFWGLDGRVLKWWSTCHDAHHHVNVISNLCDLDSAFNLHWSVLLQAMSAAACFMISGECVPTYTTCVIKLASSSLLLLNSSIYVLLFWSLLSFFGGAYVEFMYYIFLNYSLLCLSPASVELTREFCEQLDGLVGPQLTLLASDICEQFTINRRISGSVEDGMFRRIIIVFTVWDADNATASSRVTVIFLVHILIMRWVFFHSP